MAAFVNVWAPSPKIISVVVEILDPHGNSDSGRIMQSERISVRSRHFYLFHYMAHTILA